MVVVTSAKSMVLPQLIGHSLYYHIQDNLSNDGLDTTYVSVAEAYPSTGSIIDAPTIVIVEGDFGDTPLEIGGSDIAHISYVLDVYGNNKTQRNTLSWLMRHYLNDKRVAVKDYNEGFPPSVSNQTILGYFEIEDIQINAPIVYIEGEVPESLRWLKQVSVEGQYIVN